MEQHPSYGYGGGVVECTSRDEGEELQGSLKEGTSIGLLGGPRTLLVVAHRLHTIMDCDGVLVLDKGVLVEQGPPGELQCKEGGLFAALVAATAAADAKA